MPESFLGLAGNVSDSTVPAEFPLGRLSASSNTSKASRTSSINDAISLSSMLYSASTSSVVRLLGVLSPLQ